MAVTLVNCMSSLFSVLKYDQPQTEMLTLPLGNNRTTPHHLRMEFNFMTTVHVYLQQSALISSIHLIRTNYTEHILLSRSIR